MTGRVIKPEFVTNHHDSQILITGVTSNSGDEFDENDKKIIQLYEVINELMDEQKARAQDLELLYNGNIDHSEVLSFVEARNETVLKQLFEELQLTEKKDDGVDNDSTEDDEEDEQDEGWEIYNSVVQNLNQYMQKIADFSAKLHVQQELIDTYEGPQADDIKELESVITAQTQALEQQMRRNGELESALANVLAEYSSRITVSNSEISSLHAQLSAQNDAHAQQLKLMRDMYENRIKDLSKSSTNVYRRELDELLSTFSTSRDNFHSTTNQMAKDLRELQEKHHKEVVKLTYDVTNVTAQLADKQLRIRELEQKLSAVKQPQLQRVTTELQIDDADDFDFDFDFDGGSTNKRSFQAPTNTNPNPNTKNQKQRSYASPPRNRNFYNSKKSKKSGSGSGSGFNSRVIQKSRKQRNARGEF